MGEFTDKYPVVLKTSNTLGRYLAAARNIEPGELVLADTPIIVCPNTPAANNCSTCLGCCGISQTMTQCSKCGWPICKPVCEEIEDHANFECKIFTERNIKLPLPSPYCFIAHYEYIKVLRCLLLKEYGPEDRWNLFRDFEAHVDLRKSVPKILLMSKLVQKFIQDLCKLDQFDDEVIDFVLGAIDVNSFRNASIPIFQSEKGITNSKPRCATLMYHKGSLVAHGCKRNTQSLTFANNQLEMRAGDFIGKGEPITHAYCELMVGTLARRKLLKEQFYFDCTCERCSDPTELKTYFSALKCKQCSEGYLLMDNPLDFSPYWKCNKCSEIQPTEYEAEIVKDFKCQENKILKRGGESNETTVSELMKLHNAFSDILHENHYILLESQVTLVKLASKNPNANATMMGIIQKIVEKYKKLYNTFYPNVETNVPIISN